MRRRAELVARAQESAAIAAALVDGHAAVGNEGRRLHAVAGHLVSYWTWRSLVVEQGLGKDEAVEVAVQFLCAPRGRATR